MPRLIHFRRRAARFFDSLFARTLLLTAGLIVLTTLIWLLLFSLLASEPRAKATAELASSAVNLVRAALLTSSPEKLPQLLGELRDSEGIRLLPAENDDRLQPLPPGRYYQLLAAHLLRMLGDGTRLAQAVNDEPGFWISFHLTPEDEREYWVILPPERARVTLAWHWLLWGLLALLLALLAAWRIASRLTRPLSRLAEATRLLAQGKHPEALPEQGARELQNLAAAFNRMASTLARNERERAEVLAGISHDLRTPLTRLRLEAEISLDAETRRAVVADLEQMENVIAQFLDYARGEPSETPSLDSPLALLAALAQRQDDLGTPIASDIAPLPAVRHYPHALARAVGNLLDNAWKYGAAPISLSCGVTENGWWIEVADHGPGIPEAECENVRQPFKRLDTARSGATGTGLGLAIVERIARWHGGELQLLPGNPCGLRARLYFPHTTVSAGGSQTRT